MHCSANVDDDGRVAIFFGLSGTGKTTLSADPERHLIGDDEHGWGDSGVFNFEGGCYAKVIRLSAEAEPQIYATTRRFGTILENVAVDENGVLDLDDDSKTENTRAAYKLEEIANALPAKRAGHPSAVVMLTADAFGILPPIARLTREQAMFYFLSGYTAKVAGTEIGVTEPQATFSTCFGAPFLPQPPAVYARMLGEKLDEHPDATVWLVNTGWTGGPFGEGHRMPIAATRALLRAALEGELRGVEYRDRPGVRLRGAGRGAGRRLDAPRPALDVGRPGGVRPQGGRAGDDVPRELRPVRGHRRRLGLGRRAAPRDPRRALARRARLADPARGEGLRGARPRARARAGRAHGRPVPCAARQPRARGFAGGLVMDSPRDLDLVYPAGRERIAPVLRSYEPDLLLCTAFPMRIPADALAVPTIGCVNGHPSLLPRYRGRSPMGWAVRNGETEIGLTFHLMDERLRHRRDPGAETGPGGRRREHGDALAEARRRRRRAPARRLRAPRTRRQGRPAGGRRLPEPVRRRLRLRRHVPDRARRFTRQVRAWRIAIIGRNERGPILERDGERIRLLRSSLTEVEGAERLDCADGPLWLIETECCGRTSSEAPGLPIRVASNLVEAKHDVLVVGAGLRGHAGGDRGVRRGRRRRAHLQDPSRSQPLRRGRGRHQRGARERLRGQPEKRTRSTPSRAPTTSATRTRSRSSATRRRATSISSSTGARSSRAPTTGASRSGRSAPPASRAPPTPRTSRATCSIQVLYEQVMKRDMHGLRGVLRVEARRGGRPLPGRDLLGSARRRAEDDRRQDGHPRDRRRRPAVHRHDERLLVHRRRHGARRCASACRSRTWR